MHKFLHELETPVSEEVQMLQVLLLPTILKLQASGIHGLQSSRQDSSLQLQAHLDASQRSHLQVINSKI